jgi:hypothetical protein
VEEKRLAEGRRLAQRGVEGVEGVRRLEVEVGTAEPGEGAGGEWEGI